MLDGSARWVSAGGNGYIYLTGPTVTTPAEAGLMQISDLDAGAEVGGFTANFKVQVGPGTGNPADGWSFSWAPDVSVIASGEMEEGTGTGLRVAFDIYDNGGGEAPAIDVKIGTTVIASKKLSKADIMTTGFADVSIRFLNGLLSVDFKGQPVHSSVPLALGPQSGANFSFGARTGGEAASQFIDDVNITTVPSGPPTISTVRGNAKGLLVNIVDGPGGAVDANTVTATIDGTAVTGTATKVGDTTTFTFNNSGIYTAGSTHPGVLTLSYGSPAVSTTVPFSFTVGAFTTLPASAALPAGSIDTTKRGFLWRVHQVQSVADLANTHARTEQQLSGLLGDNVANPAATGGADGPSTAPNPSTAPIAFTVSTVINFSDPTAGGTAGNFVPDAGFPGIPGTTDDDDNVAAEVLTAVEFPTAGLYRLVVNSDDGFRTTAGRNPRDPGNVVLGQFEGGRGPADSPFEVLIETPGFYPIRTIWEEGGGGSALEIFSELLDGTRLLLNDADARALKTYQIPATAMPAYLGATTPADGARSLTRPNTIEAVLFDSGTTVTDGSISMTLNGANVPIVATRTGGQTKVVGTPASSLVANTEYTVNLTYSDNTGPHTVSWKFTAGPLSQTLFVIEAEDFDYTLDEVTGALHNPKKGEAGQDVDVMPYYGGAYDGLSAIINVDYFSNDPPDGGNYRTENGSGDGNDVSIYRNDNNVGGNGSGGNLPINSSERGTYQTTVNYSHGWSGGDWFNYTREFPDNGKGGWWEVYIGLSHGESNPGNLSATLSRVTEGVGTTTQTLETLGTFSGPGTGNWARNNLVPMRNASGGMAVVRLQGLQTVRAAIGGGDYDFLIFSAANPPPPSISQTPLDSVKRDAAIFDWVLQDGGSQVNVSTVKVFLNNVDVTSSATVTKTATGATIHLDRSGVIQPAGELPWTITFNDNAVTPQTVTASGKVVVNPYPTPGVFVIEAEDFNYSEDGITGGKTNPQKGTPDLDVDVMPYLGGAYNGLSAVKGVDYNNADANDANNYRTELDANGENEVNIAAENNNRYTNDRGVYTTTSNYKIGWTATGDWANYTRTFPDNDYNVWAAMSYDGRGAGQLRGSLDLVTSNPAELNQVVQQLGTFDAVGSGGWSRNELVPMKVNGEIATIHMGGLQTVRYNMPSGDFDYLVFVPKNTQPPPPEITAVRLNANGSVTVEWTGGGILETATNITGPWTEVTGATSPFTYTPTAADPIRFVRIKRPTPAP